MILNLTLRHNHTDLAMKDRNVPKEAKIETIQEIKIDKLTQKTTRKYEPMSV